MKIQDLAKFKIQQDKSLKLKIWQVSIFGKINCGNLKFGKTRFGKVQYLAGQIVKIQDQARQLSKFKIWQVANLAWRNLKNSLCGRIQDYLAEQS